LTKFKKSEVEAFGTSAMRTNLPALAFLIGLSAPLAALAAPLNVPVDQVRKLSFSGMASSVSPGNPAIADVNVVDETTILVVGKKPGVTNLIVLDRAGRTLFNDRVVVTAADVNGVSISRGGKVTAFACTPHCQAATAVGP
jgi:Flp pilus assembly secretin CpaC